MKPCERSAWTRELERRHRVDKAPYQGSYSLILCLFAVCPECKPNLVNQKDPIRLATCVVSSRATTNARSFHLPLGPQLSVLCRSWWNRAESPSWL